MSSNTKQCCAPLRRKRIRLLEYVIYANNRASNKPFNYPSNELTTTKYTLASFVPRFLYEQFRRLPNLYFLLMAIITCIPGISPISPVSAVLPFVLIILTAGVKEAFEDFKRWQSDQEINGRLYSVLKDDVFIQLKNKDIAVGDILSLKENEEVPADCVIISSSEKDGICYVDTANLDGETTLKLFKALPEICNWNEEQLITMQAIIKCNPPIEKLTEFKGNIQIFNTDVEQDLESGSEEDSDEAGGGLSLTNKQLLLRGVRVRNTKNVYGVVVYAGKQTKLALNAVLPPSKFSLTERTINWASLIIFLVKISLVIGCTVASTIAELSLSHWYNPVYNPHLDSGTVFMSYFVLLGYFIPISLFVNLEVLKLVQAGWMVSDTDLMKDEKPMRVKNSNLNDELSRVSYIFSDKTGTLTQNKMIFDQCTIGNRKYPDAGAGGLKSLSDSDPSVKNFLLHLALNNEVLAEMKEVTDILSEKAEESHSPKRKSHHHHHKKSKKKDDPIPLDEVQNTLAGNTMPKYAAPSPDEIALVKGAFINGVQFLSRSNEGITIRFENLNREMTYQILNTMEFTSERKRSSVIVRTPEGKIILFTKGADSAIKPRLRPETDIEAVEKYLSDYSKVGLRALLYGYKELSEDEYKHFLKKYNTAAALIDGREAELAQVNNQMEQSLHLQGCSAIQDALQDKVPFTIAYLIQAGIKVWMITGDQQDTAENIGYSCQLITKNSTLVRVVKCENTDKCKDALIYAQQTVSTKNKVSLVIDGQSLVYALTDHAKLLLSVGKECETVIVCRADPLQKALVVRLMKRGTKKITLSVGDGANDVSMIQEAHIGVGIWGEEGTQAAQNADYAIRLFKHLAKLITVHGRYNMMRTAIMVEFSFYKNIALFGCQFWFGLFNLYSAQTFFDDWVMAAYNTVICSLPPLVLAFFEKDLNEDLIMKYPQIYKELSKGLYLTRQTMFSWMFTAAYHSVVIFFSILFTTDILNQTGRTGGLFVDSTCAATAGVIAILLKAMLSTHHWVWPSVVAYILSIIALFGLFSIENSSSFLFPGYYFVMNTAMEMPFFWLNILLVASICIIPEVAYEYFKRRYFPYNWQIIQELQPDQAAPKTIQEIVDNEARNLENSISEDVDFSFQKLEASHTSKESTSSSLVSSSSSSSSSSSHEELTNRFSVDIK